MTYSALWSLLAQGKEQSAMSETVTHERSEDRPTSEEVDELAERLDEIAGASLADDGRDVSNRAASLLRRLAAQSDGWRPIETFDDDKQTGKYDFWMDWSRDCKPINPPIEKSPQSEEQLFRGYYKCWPSYLRATHWRDLPAPPSPSTEEKT